VLLYRSLQAGTSEPSNGGARDVKAVVRIAYPLRRLMQCCIDIIINNNNNCTVYYSCMCVSPGESITDRPKGPKGESGGRGLPGLPGVDGSPGGPGPAGQLASLGEHTTRRVYLLLLV